MMASDSGALCGVDRTQTQTAVQGRGRKAMDPAATTSPGSRLRLADLPLEALCRVFQQSEEPSRRALASVSRRLLAVSRCPALNQDVHFSLVIAPGSPEKFDSFFSWLLHRRTAVETLRIDICREDPGEHVHMNLADQAEAWTLLCSSIVAVSTSLQKLSLHWPYEDAPMGRWMTAASGLQELRLNNTSLNVKECVVTMPSLKVLSLDSRNPPTMEWITRSSKVTKLLLSVPGDVLPAAITTLTSLAALVLDSGMSALPAGALTALTSLAIVCAAAEQLPPEMSTLTNLRQLILEEHVFPGNTDDRLSDCIAPLSQLTLLSLSRCGLAALPSAVETLPFLSDLLVDGCLFTRLPPGPYLSQLRVLSVDWGVLFNSAEALRDEMTRLILLYACTNTWAGMPDAGIQGLISAFQQHHALKRLTVLSDASAEGYCSAAVNAMLLRLPRACPGLEVEAEERGTFHPHTRDELCCFSLPVDGFGESHGMHMA